MACASRIFQKPEPLDQKLPGSLAMLLVPQTAKILNRRIGKAGNVLARHGKVRPTLRLVLTKAVFDERDKLREHHVRPGAIDDHFNVVAFGSTQHHQAED